MCDLGKKSATFWVRIGVHYLDHDGRSRNRVKSLARDDIVRFDVKREPIALNTEITAMWG